MITPLYYVWNYTDVDRRFWDRHFADWLPPNILDAHIHVSLDSFRFQPKTDAMKRQYWVSEVNEPIDMETLCRCYETVFPGRQVDCLVFGQPSLEIDFEKNNDYIERECEKRGFHGLVLLDPRWDTARLEKELDRPNIIGLKPYYAMIGVNRETRDQYLEASIFDFLPHRALEVLNERGAWATLHVPKAGRLGHPENIREIKEIRRRYPDIILVVAHLGRCYTEQHALEGLLPLADDSGIYFDTSAVINADSHYIALKHIGPDRLIYGTDNPIFFMRGRRQFAGTSYVNRTNHPFYFNKEREPAEIEARYTLMMYEDIYAVKQAMIRLGMERSDAVEKVFHSNARGLVEKVLNRKRESLAGR